MFVVVNSASPQLFIFIVKKNVSALYHSMTTASVLVEHTTQPQTLTTQYLEYFYTIVSS